MYSLFRTDEMVIAFRSRMGAYARGPETAWHRIPHSMLLCRASYMLPFYLEAKQKLTLGDPGFAPEQ